MAVATERDVGGELRRLRRLYGLTMLAVAREAGVHNTWLSVAERGYRQISAEQETALRRAIRVLVRRRREELAG